jgi:signal transduction histidine kinase
MPANRLNRDQFASVLQNAAAAITVQDAAGALIYANQAAADLTGFPDPDALLSASPEERRGRFQVFDDKGEAVASGRWPAQLVRDLQRPQQTILRYGRDGDPADRWSISKATPVFDDAGKLLYVITATQDITDVMQGEERLRLLADASELLASSLDFDETLAKVAHLAVPRFADWAAVDLLEQGGSIRRLAMAGTERLSAERARDLHTRYSSRLDTVFGPERVIQTGVPILLPDLSPEMVRDAQLDEESLELLREIGLCSVIVVPLRARGRVLGAITFMAAESGRHYVRADLTLATELANHAALAVDNARLYEEAREAVDARDRVLSSVSHDLRTPLTTIRGMTQVLLRRVDRSSQLSSPQVLDRLSLLDRSAAQMSVLIDDILDLARLKAGRPLDLNRERLDLSELITQTLDRMRDEGSEPRIALEAEGGELSGEWDPRRLERVLRSMLAHVAKCNPRASALTVQIRRTTGNGQEARAEVLTLAEADTLNASEGADRSIRAQDATSRYITSDIDLEGARKIVEQHGGALAVEGREGQPVSIRMLLPLG